MIKKIFFILVISFCFVPFFASAEDFVGPTQPTFTLLEPLPSDGGDLEYDVSLEEYTSWIFSFALTIAAFLAVLMITVGGITYMASGGNESMVTKGRGYITNALYGLLLAFGAYLLLRTINPQLVSFKFIESLEEYKSSSEGGSSVNDPDDPSTWDTVRDDSYYDTEGDFNFTDEELENWENATDPANSYTNEGASATGIGSEDTRNEEETREQFETSPNDAGLLNFD